FLLMMGDQVYVDEDKPQVFTFPTKMDSPTRRAAIVEKYRASWSRNVVQQVLANIPTYMVWDDHDCRDGWGSLASDSPTLVAQFPRGAAMFADVVGHFEDCRDVYWHFQACHNPMPDDANVVFPNYIIDPPVHGERHAMPFAFRCGRVAVLMLESRGERDVFRDEFPILGPRQWQFIDDVFGNLADDIDVLAVVTPTPVASMDPNGGTQKLMGLRTDDVEAFKRGNEHDVISPYQTQDFSDLVLAAIGARVSRLTGTSVNLGVFKIGNIDEARDQWSHHFARPEQELLLRKANAARLTNRPSDNPRELIFLAGDIHVGCIHDISFSDPEYKATLLTSSGISAKANTKLVVGTFVDEDFNVADGIHSTLRDIIDDFNFGVVEVIPAPNGANINALVAHKGNSFAAGVDISKLV
ncbi:MAG: alkaline phosphatase D family protein, partial [Chthoniobacterales bacterium]